MIAPDLYGMLLLEAGLGCYLLFLLVGAAVRILLWGMEAARRESDA